MVWLVNHDFIPFSMRSWVLVGKAINKNFKEKN